MKSYRKVLTFRTQKREEIIDITEQIRTICQESQIREGLVLVFPYHTSSAVYLSDSDFSLTQDFANLLTELVPAQKDYLHNLTDYKKNAAAHLKAILAGHHLILPLTGGKLDLGVYQTIYYAEFDGGREKEVLVKIIGE